MTSVVARAFEVAAKAWSGYRGVPLSEFVPDRDSRIAAPFGKPITAPAYEWRVSRDVWDDLCDYAGMNEDDPSPESRLLGEHIAIDETLPANSMLLEPHR